MSQENVEVVRQGLQAFADGGVDAMAEFWDPDINWRAAEGAIDDVGEMHGPVAVRRYIQDWIDNFDDASVVVEELRDVGDDRVLAIQRVKGRAKLSGIEIDLRYAVVNSVRDGKVVRGREYLSVEEALEAVGLSEYRLLPAATCAAGCAEVTLGPPVGLKGCRNTTVPRSGGCRTHLE